MKLIDLLFPRRCAVCGRKVDREARQICGECLMRLSFLPTDGCCRVCSRPVEGVDGEYLCEDCGRLHVPHFDRAVQVFRSEGDAYALILEFKFRGGFHLRDDLVDFLEAVVRARLRAEEIDIVTGMPLTLPHRWRRGYNPTDMLARPLASRLDRMYRMLLARVGNPKQQSTLSEAERRVNVINTFAVRHPEYVRGRTVLVVDDVMTTGSTLSESARVLKAAGARRVWCAALGRSVRV